MMEKRYTLGQVAKIANKTRHTIWLAVKAKRLEAIYLRGKYHVSETDLREYPAVNQNLITNSQLAAVLGCTSNTVFRWKSPAKQKIGKLEFWNLSETLEWIRTNRPRYYEKLRAHLETKTKWNGDPRQVANN